MIFLVEFINYFTCINRYLFYDPLSFLQFRMLKEMVLVLKEGRAAKDGESPRFKLSA